MPRLLTRRAFLRYTAGAIASAVSVPAVFAASEQDESTEPKVTEHLVEITDFAFVPATLEVREGDTITWINRDIAPHTATANDGSWDTGFLGLGEQGSLVVSADMLTGYYCQYHPMMKAKLEIRCQD